MTENIYEYMDRRPGRTTGPAYDVDLLKPEEPLYPSEEELCARCEQPRSAHNGSCPEVG